MTTWVIVIIVLLVLGIIFFTGISPHKQKTRQEYLDELNKLLEGKLIPLEADHGYMIAFNFEGRDFILEDLEQEGFGEKVHKAFLKAKINSTFTMSCTEAVRITIRSKVVRTSEITDQPIEKLDIPKALKKFKIFTNNVEKANALFAHAPILSIISHYANTGPRGEAAMGLRIQDGTLILEFFSHSGMHPNLFDLMHNPAKIETELFNLIRLAKAVEAP